MSHGWKFVAFTLAISWSSAGLYYVTGGDWNTIPATIFAIAYMFVPLAVGSALAFREEGRGIRDVLGLHFSFNRWWIVAWLLPVVVAAGAVGVALLFPGVEFTTGLEGMIDRFRHMLSAEQIEQMRESVHQLPVHPFWLAIAQGLVAGVTINGLAGLGEEAGWRGYLYDKWRSLGFWRYSGAVGSIWGIWHAPLILQGHNYPQHPVAGVGMMVVFCVLYSPIFTFARDRTGSAIGAAILHGTLNGTLGVALIPVAGGNDLIVGITGVAGFVVLAAANLLLLVLLSIRPRLGQPYKPDTATDRDNVDSGDSTSNAGI